MMRATFLHAVRQAMRPIRRAGIRAALVTQSNIQRYIRALLTMESELCTLAVMSYDELPNDRVLYPLGCVRVDGPSRRANSTVR